MRLDACSPLTPLFAPPPRCCGGELRSALWCCRDLTYAEYLWCTRCPAETVVVDVYEPVRDQPIPFATYLRGVNEADRRAERAAALTTVLPANSPAHIPTDMRTADARPAPISAAALPRLGQVSPVEQGRPAMRVEETFRTNRFLGIGARIDLMG